MPAFTFDMKALVTVLVTAADEATARALLDNYAPDLLDGGAWISADDGQDVRVNSASQDGDADLTEVDGVAQ